jgi:hypothetical protein
VRRSSVDAPLALLSSAVRFADVLGGIMRFRLGAGMT